MARVLDRSGQMGSASPVCPPLDILMYGRTKLTKEVHRLEDEKWIILDYTGRRA